MSSITGATTTDLPLIQSAVEVQKQTDGQQISSEREAFLGIQSDLLIGTYSQSIAQPTPGDEITLSADGGLAELELDVGANIYLAAINDCVGTNARGKLVTYDTVTGSMTIYIENVTDTWNGGSSYLVWQQDGPQVNLVVGYSFDTFTVPGENTQAAFTIDQPKLPLERSSNVLVYDASNFSNAFRMRVTAWDELTGEVEGEVNWSNNSGVEASKWLIVPIPGPLSGNAAAVSSFSFVDYSTGDYLTNERSITIPAATQAGDVIVIYNMARKIASAPASFTPVGFTKVIDEPSSTPTCGRTVLSIKVADGSEAGQSIGLMTDTDFDPVTASAFKAMCQVFRPDVPGGTLVVGTSSAIAATTRSGSGTSEVLAVAAMGDFGVAVAAYYYALTSAPAASPDPTIMTPQQSGTNVYLDSGSPGSVGYVEMSYRFMQPSPAPSDITVGVLAHSSYNTFSAFWFTMVATTSAPGDVVVFEDDGVGGPAYPPGDGSQIDGVPKVLLDVTVTPTLISGNISSVNTTTNVITWSTTLSVSTGDTVIPAGAGTWPAPFNATRGAVFIHVLTTTTFTLHASRSDALTGSNPIDITSSGSGTRQLYELVESNLLISKGILDSRIIEGPGTLTADIAFKINLDPALTSTERLVMIQMRWLGTGLGSFDGQEGVLSDSQVAVNPKLSDGTTVTWATNTIYALRIKMMIV